MPNPTWIETECKPSANASAMTGNSNVFEFSVGSKVTSNEAISSGRAESNKNVNGSTRSVVETEIVAVSVSPGLAVSWLKSTEMVSTSNTGSSAVPGSAPSAAAVRVTSWNPSSSVSSTASIANWAEDSNAGISMKEGTVKIGR